MLQLERERRDAPFLIAVLAHAVIIFAAYHSSSIRLPEGAGAMREVNQAESAVDIIFLTDKVPGVGRAASRVISRIVPSAPVFEIPELSEGESTQWHMQQAGAFAVEWAMPTGVPGDTAAREHSIDQLADGPRFTSFSRAPKLRNEEDIRRLLTRRFPVELRRKGGDVRANVWLLIDSQGKVFKAVLRDTSGFAGADSLAVEASYQMDFDPAEQAGRNVAVWVQQPVRFQVRDMY